MAPRYRVRKAHARAAPRPAPVPQVDGGLLRLPRLVGNKAFQGMVREARPVAGPPLQRVVLHDVDFDKLQHVNEGYAYMDARPFVDEYEIAQSAQVLGNLYGMKVRPIRKPSKVGSAILDEPLVLVGHGGQGQFMNMTPLEFEGYLSAWGVAPQTQVVLAGCSTSGAAAAIDVVRRLTGRPPIVNRDLAFTVPGSGEYVVPDAEAVRDAFKVRNNQLRKIDLAMLERVRDRLKGAFFAEATKDNYALAVEVVQAFRAGSKLKPIVVAAGFTPKSGPQVTAAWVEVLKRFDPGAKVSAGDVMEGVMG
ncbi:MAG TPA: hypothetical protein VEU29_04695, partial [Actinomycetota bacterium]|nr:hypothetical protein [Actinomycetota bacterium]